MYYVTIYDSCSNAYREAEFDDYDEALAFEHEMRREYEGTTWEVAFS